MKFRVAEIFGPTVQGEGRRAGLPCYFVRFGGCDYRCTWCDSPHAVLPHLVAQLPQMNEEEIMEALRALPVGPRWVVLSGGNPAVLNLKVLVAHLMERYSVMVETQGTVFRSWLGSVDEMCVSPKPPSAGNVTQVETLKTFMRQVNEHTPLSLSTVYLKVVVFDKADYEYAKEIRKAFPNHTMYLSVGTYENLMPTVGTPENLYGHKDTVRDIVSEDFRKVAEWVANDMQMWDVRVLPQLHVLAWGVERGH